MFGKQQDPSRTEEATPKRVSKQRSEGNVAKSQEMSKFVSLVAGMIGLFLWIETMGDEVMGIYRHFLTRSFEFQADSETVYSLFLWISAYLAKILLPILAFLGISAWLCLRLQVGSLWTTKVFKPKLEKFNVIKSLKQMLASPQTIFRLLKSLLFSLVIATIPAIIISQEYVNFLPMFYEDAAGVVRYMLDTGFTLVYYTLIPMGAIAGFDVWQSRYAYNEGNKMTKDEIKDERKQSEGDPLVKQQQRQKMMEQLARRMLQDVPKADVVITNPTHIAVALSYNVMEAPAPIVLAIGADHMAEKIKEVAREHNVPIRENVPLARALYKSVEVGDMIPEELYKATASILASIWRMKGKMPGK